jgi:ATP-dependent Clp protease adapter protein ClpS
MIAKELEIALHNAFVKARGLRHEVITVEHLLDALLDTPSSAGVLRGCGADIERLREQLVHEIEQRTPRVAEHADVETQPTLGFQRVIQRAILHVQSSNKKEVDGAETLIALLGEKDSHAARLLQEHAVTRLAAALFLSHGAVAAASTDTGSVAELQVVLYNDDFTPMEFVVGVLERFFGMDADDAKETMLEVHREGSAVCGLYAREAAQDLVGQVAEHARSHGHPLRCAIAIPR